MNIKVTRFIARLIIIAIGVLFIFGFTQCARHEESVDYITYDYHEYKQANTARVLDITYVPDEEESEPIDDGTSEVEEVSEPIVEEEIKYASVEINSYNVLSNVDMDPYLFEQVVSEISPGLSGIGGAIINNYENYGLKPSFQLAVFCLESSYGKSGLAEGKNNIGGLNAYATSTATVYENAFSYETKSDCVDHFGNIMYDRYISDGLVTVSSIANRYCPPNSSHWSNNVMNLMIRIDSLYNAKLTDI